MPILLCDKRERQGRERSEIGEWELLQGCVCLVVVSGLDLNFGS